VISPSRTASVDFPDAPRPKMSIRFMVAVFPNRFGSVRHPAISQTPLTRHPPYHSDKLSRLALPSESVERHSPCGIRNLGEGGPLAPVLPRKLALVRFQAMPYKAIPSRSQKRRPGPQHITWRPRCLGAGGVRRPINSEALRQSKPSPFSLPQTMREIERRLRASALSNNPERNGESCGSRCLYCSDCH
jgi:hypothetical protein